jgi:PST family polysaccharide transporter
MVTAVTGFAALFKELGLSMATVQKAEVSHEQVSVLFWVNVAVSILIACVTAASAPVIAWFYGEPRLVPIGVVLSLAFVFGGLTVQHEALLRRQMRFTALAVIPVTSMAIGVIAAIAAALLGAGYWAVVVMQLTIPLAHMLAVWVFCRWRPGLPLRRSGVRSMLHFGANLTGFNILNYVARNLDKVLIGRVCGPASLGLYAKAYSLLMLPITQIRGPLNAVALPVLCRVQDDAKRYASIYEKLVLLLSFISMPVVVFLAVCSDSVIRLVLGDQWTGASRIFQVLAIIAFIQPVAGTRGLVLVSLGQSRRYLKWGLWSAICTVCSFIVGIRWGLLGLATAYMIEQYLILLPSLWYCFRLSPVSSRIFIRAISRSVAASLVMSGAILAIQGTIAQHAPHVKIIVCFASGAAAYAGAWLLVPGGRRTLREMGQYALTLARPRRSHRNASDALNR